MPARSRYGGVDPRNPAAAGRCDRGGEVRKHSELQEQTRWAGNRLVGTGWLVCAQHMDIPNPQDRGYRLRADGVSIPNPRPLIELTSGGSPSGGLTGLDYTFILDASTLA